MHERIYRARHSTRISTFNFDVRLLPSSSLPLPLPPIHPLARFLSLSLPARSACLPVSPCQHPPIPSDSLVFSLSFTLDPFLSHRRSSSCVVALAQIIFGILNTSDRTSNDFPPRSPFRRFRPFDAWPRPVARRLFSRVREIFARFHGGCDFSRVFFAADFFSRRNDTSRHTTRQNHRAFAKVGRENSAKARTWLDV